jgi:hypothetical protein
MKLFDVGDKFLWGLFKWPHKEMRTMNPNDYLLFSNVMLSLQADKLAVLWAMYLSWCGL